jgi:hypothetical protein
MQSLEMERLKIPLYLPFLKGDRKDKKGEINI